MSVPDFPLPSHIEMNSMGSSIARPGDQHHALKTNTNANGALRGEERPLDEKHSHSTRLLFKPSTAKPRYMISYQQYEYPEKGRSGWRRVRERVTVVLLSIIAILFLVFTKGHLVTEPWHALENRFSPWRFNAKAASLAQASSTTSSVLTPTASVLNVFQVHQPVFVTQSSNNGPNGGSPASCTVLLMEHSFGWSYGMPFVGKIPIFDLSNLNSNLHRELYPSFLRVQSRRYEFYRHVERQTIRPPRFDVFWRY
jgi:hypothetical protein